MIEHSIYIMIYDMTICLFIFCDLCIYRPTVYHYMHINKQSSNRQTFYNTPNVLLRILRNKASIRLYYAEFAIVSSVYYKMPTYHWLTGHIFVNLASSVSGEMPSLSSSNLKSYSCPTIARGSS